MKAIVFVLIVTLLSIVPTTFAQAKPDKPAVTPPASTGDVSLTADEKLDLSQELNDLQDTTIRAYQTKGALDDLNTQLQQKSAAVNQKLDKLRKDHGMPPDAFFDRKKLAFVKAPTTPEKK